METDAIEGTTIEAPREAPRDSTILGGILVAAANSALIKAIAMYTENAQTNGEKQPWGYDDFMKLTEDIDGVASTLEELFSGEPDEVEVDLDDPKNYACPVCGTTDYCECLEGLDTLPVTCPLCGTPTLEGQLTCSCSGKDINQIT